MPKLTIAEIEAAHPQFKISFHVVRGKRSYSIHHIPSGKNSVCILGNKLSSVLRVIVEAETLPSDHTNPLNCSMYFR